MIIDNIHSKIQNLELLKLQLDKWNSDNKIIVFTNGCFDILHLGHIEYLSKAKDLGDILIVGINSDNSQYWKTKGSNRPINDEKSRSMIVASLSFVDIVVLFNKETPLELIEFIKPDILVKGKDYEKENIIGYDFIKSYGGWVKTIEITEGYSTSNIISKIRN